MDHIILAVHVTDRVKNVSKIQTYLTDYGCFIKTRLGLHEASDNECSPNGMILLEMVDNTQKMNELKTKLNSIDGVEAKELIFSH